MKAYSIAILVAGLTGFCSIVSTAQIHPLIGKWRTKLQWTGDIGLAITSVRSDNFIEGTFTVPRFKDWNCKFSDKVDYPTKKCTGYYDGTWLTIKVPRGATYTVQLVSKRLKGKLEAAGNPRIRTGIGNRCRRKAKRRANAILKWDRGKTATRHRLLRSARS